MSTNPLIPSSFPTNSNNNNNNHLLFAAIDLGSNSFKLRIIKTNPNTNHRFITLHRLKEPVVLVSGGPTISTSASSRALTSLHNFKQIITSLNIPNENLRLVATSAIRESSNQLEFVELVRKELGFDIEVLSGFDEARLTYLGVLQFYPVFDRTVLTIDIGGGSTEFVVGFRGIVKLGVSLKLGHVTLTQKFVGNKAVGAMREYIRNVVKESGLVDKVKGEKLDLVIGSSGSIRMIEKANFMRWNGGLVNEIGLFEGFRREWKFSKEELRELVEKMCDDAVDGKVFKKRSAFILAAVVLLDEVFELFGIKEMEVSGFALGEGVIAEKLAEVYDGFDLNANARWRSVLRLASRFCNKERMTSAASCASIAQGIFTGLRKWGEIGERNEVIFDDKDLEYLEAACLLHNIGSINGKKGYHKRSYHIIMEIVLYVC
uniref:Ppx/GppA phosphatase N-terminal domain-containing protein n=1 Tax=Tanacetum cinerariifolium TaxID=118510 RepID=A0A699L906_TANCI|nr:hypothetical protein [Tanacetum cinerariifolium]